MWSASTPAFRRSGGPGYFPTGSTPGFCVTITAIRAESGARPGWAPRVDPPSHARIVRSAPAFRRDPDDVLPRILDVAGLAVNAVRGIDLQPLCRTARGLVGDEFVNRGRTIALLRSVVDLEIDADRNGRVAQAQMHRLVFLVVGVGEEDRREL